MANIIRQRFVSGLGVFRRGVFRLGVFRLGVFRLGVFRRGVVGLGVGVLLAMAGMLGAGTASADAPSVSFTVSPIEGHGPWVYELAITNHEAQRVAVDRRLLEFTVRPEGSRRTFVCRPR